MNHTADQHPMDIPITYRGTVYPWHCDHMGHMNVMWYVNMFDAALWNLLARLGLTPGYLRERGRGMAAVEQTIRYQRELLPGDTVCVRSRILEARDKALIVEQTMTDDAAGHHAATMRLTAVHLDTALRKAVAFEAPIAAALHRHAVPN